MNTHCVIFCIFNIFMIFFHSLDIRVINVSEPPCVRLLTQLNCIGSKHLTHCCFTSAVQQPPSLYQHGDRNSSSRIQLPRCTDTKEKLLKKLIIVCRAVISYPVYLFVMHQVFTLTPLMLLVYYVTITLTLPGHCSQRCFCWRASAVSSGSRLVQWHDSCHKSESKQTRE